MISIIWRLLPRGNVLLLRQLKQTTALVFTTDDNVQLKILVTQLKILGSTSTFYRDYVKVCAVPRRTIRIDSYPLLGRFVHGTPVRKQKNYQQLQSCTGGKQSSERNSFLQLNQKENFPYQISYILHNTSYTNVAF